MKYVILFLIPSMLLLQGCLSSPDTAQELDHIHDESHSHSGEDTGGFGEEVKDLGNSKVIHTIYYTNTGFQPNTLTIQRGETVVFINTTSLGLRPASDPHPLHTDYQGFDSYQGIGSGESVGFLFSTIGTYGFHNHIKSNHRGVVRIYDPNNPTPNIIKSRPADYDTRDTLLAIFDPHDSNSIRTLFATIKANKKLAENCHDIAHDLGHKAYELYGMSRALTFDNVDVVPMNDVDDLCAGGYMHGVLEEVFLHTPQTKDNPGPICDAIPREHKGSCYHGVGHGIMFAHNRQIKPSIQSCLGITGSVWQHRCYEGVFMELFWGNTDHAGGYLGRDLEKPMEACAGYGDEEIGACFLYAHLGYLRTHPRDYAGIMNLCLSARDVLPAIHINYCIKGIGITMMKSVNSLHLERTELFAGRLNHEQKNWYYQGVIGYAVLSGVKKETIKHVCQAMKKDTDVCMEVYYTMRRD